MIGDLEAWAEGSPADSPVWRQIRYLTQHAAARRLRYDVFRSWRLPRGSGAIASTIRRVINRRLKGNSISWTEENAEAVSQLRAAVVSGRRDEIFEHPQEAMARDRRKTWRWTPPDCLGELKAREAKDDERSQAPSAKRTKRHAA